MNAVPYVFCRLMERDEPAADDSTDAVDAVLALNGDVVATRKCTSVEENGDPHYPPRRREIASVGPYLWMERYEINPGETFDVSMWLQQEARQVDVAGAEFGVAFVVESIEGCAPPCG